MHIDVNHLLSQLTLEEKASLCSGLDYWHLKGIARLDIPSIMVADGPHGLRKLKYDTLRIDQQETIPATCFPTASALAATWNQDLLYEMGVALAEECRQERVSVILGPGANIKRSPLCGRNFEYFSEDPYLSGKLAASLINGLQSLGIGASLKHYAVNNQEHRRFTIDAVVDERALREIYLTSFEIAIKESQPWTVMGAYNKINGTYASDHTYLMRDVLKNEWAHDGIVVTDWGAMNDRVAALAAGTHLEMPASGSGGDARITKAVRSGQLDEAVLDESVGQILKFIARSSEVLSQTYTYDAESHHALARRVAGEAIVLLKNEGGMLPLKTDAKIALLGRFAKYPRYQGGGSSLVTPTRLDTLYDELLHKVGEGNLLYAPGYTKKSHIPNDRLIREAMQCANDADVVVLCVGLTDVDEVEGVDREHLRLSTGHEALLEAIIEMHSNVVVVLSNGSPVEMDWAGHVPAILEGYLGGQAGAGAMSDVLFGTVNPSGKLAETFPNKLADTPAHRYFPGGPTTVEYRESIYVGYRYYDSAGADVLFPFGHGLSYTTFEYRDVRVSQMAIMDTDTLTVSFTIKNTGARAGQEIAQVYVRDVESTAFRPDKELKGFTKIALEPDEQMVVSLELEARAFAHYDVGHRKWLIESGKFEILVGASSRDIRLRTVIQMRSSHIAPTPVDEAMLAPYYDVGTFVGFSDDAFAALLGYPLPMNRLPRQGMYTLNTPVVDMHESFFARRFAAGIQAQVAHLYANQEDESSTRMVEASVKEMPLRGMYLIDRRLNHHIVEGLLHWMNGRILKALGYLVRGIFQLIRRKR